MSPAPANRAKPPRRRSRRYRTLLGLAAWALLMSPLLWWGLPGTRDDDLLFGGRPAWTADRYRASSDLARLRQRPAGADVDLNPLPDRSRIIDLTATEETRAEILRRYRLYSRQPDEMIIFRALQCMDPRRLDFDPRLYQYGGGYLYLIGAATAMAGALGLIRLSSDIGFYLEHPEYFAHFYVVARAVSLLFGALTLVAVGRLARRAVGERAGYLAMLLVACTPVFITAVLEAKPHLPSACLILWACLSALDYLDRGRLRDALRLGVQAGYASGLVLTGVAALALWPALWFVRRCGRPEPKRDGPSPSQVQPGAAGQPSRMPAAQRHLLLAAGVAVLVYAVTNPYVIYNSVTGRGALKSNLANSLSMYKEQVRQVPAGAKRVSALLDESLGSGAAVMGASALAFLTYQYGGRVVLVASPGLAMLGLCVVLAAGKPAEFARFLILPAVLMMTASAISVVLVWREHKVVGGVLLLMILATVNTPAYLHAFFTDAWGHDHTRRQAGAYLAEHLGPDDAVGVLQEPAPYAVPPLDFTRRRVLWLPPAAPSDLHDANLPRWVVYCADDDQTYADAWWRSQYRLAASFPDRSGGLSRICWANKPVFIWQRADHPP